MSTNRTNFEIGQAVYLDPETGKQCQNYSAVQSSTGMNRGCMKWYIYKIQGSNLGLLLDHNTTAKVAWATKEDYIAAGGTETNYGPSGNNNLGPVTVLKQLAIDAATWKFPADLFGVQDITYITGNRNWTQSISSFYLDTNTETISPTCRPEDTSGCKYRWLYDRTGLDCVTQSGCLFNSDVQVYGYWTKTSMSTNRAYVVHKGAEVTSLNTVTMDSYGIRPVIQVPKIVFE